ncbi:MAG TPA: TetR/AcrR family transcriptional regulator [Chitinophagales bacterium]|nr:TetR/AcrR family transcriptional regulator [Chitinophagales bacterium]HMU98060.1 TetR/AcrR family transcriptional regulator [Chitinophagales bacterium]HMV03550.1 TetR/AcrR family transcriptional regulator [Chitinophagales bacterium]HMW94581.1 TetR/AcrR family transcriptional regulator [Chitinophagales bacterium]HMY42300.1 TetR/AcrR family transcriptional regulator [Chitinophagales bacterium]
MPKQKVTSEEILKQSFKLFREKSYHNTSMADIADACGILKGSLYHYYSSKEALMSAVIDYAHTYFKEKIFSLAYNEELSPQERIERMFQKSEKTLLSDGNIMGNIGVETARIVPEFANLIKDFYMEWINAVAYIFRKITNEKDAQDLAEQTVAEFEGAVMMSRIFKDTRFMNNAYLRLKSRFAAITLSDFKH